MKIKSKKFRQNWVCLLSGLVMATLPSIASSVGSEFAFKATYGSDVLTIKSHLEGIFPDGPYVVELEVQGTVQADELAEVDLEFPQVREKTVGRLFKVKLDEEGDLSVKGKYDIPASPSGFASIKLIISYGLVNSVEIVNVSKRVSVPYSPGDTGCPPNCGGGF